MPFLTKEKQMNIVLIGSSTGGPNQLKFLLNDIDFSNACVIIAQHMSANFIPSFVRQFNQEAKAEVILAGDNELLMQGKIYICQQNSVFGGLLNISLNFSPEKTTFNPNINLLFNSALNIAHTNNILAILLTGMADDGAAGLFELYKKGVKCMCENEKDCVVFGMPKKAIELNPKLRALSLNEIKKEILKFIK